RARTVTPPPLPPDPKTPAGRARAGTPAGGRTRFDYNFFTPARLTCGPPFVKNSRASESEETLSARRLTHDEFFATHLDGRHTPAPPLPPRALGLARAAARPFGRGGDAARTAPPRRRRQRALRRRAPRRREHGAARLP